ncbi:unnamed protein product [Thlaspi arvense]|uniref:S-protein homolog n=1 Tax=Thlaspi arvense TaxID=13288 RepID=A0AAU9T231_THLAR|nr:unnamed protein product [Thlaspi arvense]
MNRLSCFLLAMALYVGLNNAAVFEKNSVHFKSSLGPDSSLRIHCVSDQDDLGVHFLRPGQTYDFSFHDSVLKTIIECNLYWMGPRGAGHGASFRAYEGGGVIVHYGKQNFWDARVDGVYFTHGKETPKLEYKWTIG